MSLVSLPLHQKSNIWQELDKGPKLLSSGIETLAKKDVLMRRRPEYSRGRRRGRRQRTEHEIYLHTPLAALQIARGGGRGPRRARRQRGAAAPRRGTTAPGREHHETRRAIKGSSKGFFTGRGVLFDSTFYVQGTNLARRLALEYVSTSACRTRWTYLIHSTGRAGRPRVICRAPAGQ